MSATEPDAREALAERLLEDTTRTLELFSVYLGVKLGLYRALANRGDADPGGLAAAAGVQPRYAREWLEQQTTAGPRPVRWVRPG